MRKDNLKSQLKNLKRVRCELIKEINKKENLLENDAHNYQPKIYSKVLSNVFYCLDKYEQILKKQKKESEMLEE